MSTRAVRTANALSSDPGSRTALLGCPLPLPQHSQRTLPSLNLDRQLEGRRPELSGFPCSPSSAQRRKGGRQFWASPLQFNFKPSRPAGGQVAQGPGPLFTLRSQRYAPCLSSHSSLLFLSPAFFPSFSFLPSPPPSPLLSPSPSSPSSCLTFSCPGIRPQTVPRKSAALPNRTVIVLGEAR